MVPKIEYTVAGVKRRFNFPYPPKELEIERHTPKEAVKEAIDGSRQVVTFSIIKSMTQQFMFLERAFVVDTLQPFYLEHAIFGRPFKYFQDSESASFITYELDKREFNPTRNTSTPDLYDITMTLRRV